MGSGLRTDGGGVDLHPGRWAPESARAAILPRETLPILPRPGSRSGQALWLRACLFPSRYGEDPWSGCQLGHRKP